MSNVTLGPKLNLLINGDIGDFYVDQLRPFLRAVDALLFASVINSTATAPPDSPSNGDSYLLLSVPTGAWTGAQNHIAVWSTELCVPGTNIKYAGWEFHQPDAGWTVFDVGAGVMRLYSNTGWSVLNTGGGVTVEEIAFTTAQPGPFTLAHDLGKVPQAATVEMTSDGQVWFQITRYDATTLYLTASDANLTGFVKVWS